jgi:hypothetical protein
LFVLFALLSIVAYFFIIYGQISDFMVLGMTGGFGLIISGSGAPAAAPQLLACLSRATDWILTGVKWGDESWTRVTRPDSFGVSITSAPVLHWSLACSERLMTAVRRSDKGWSRLILPDHAELAASEQAQRDAARARRDGKPIWY